MRIGEPGGRDSPRLERIVRMCRAAGINAPEPRMDAWLKTHAVITVPLGQAAAVAGGPAGPGRTCHQPGSATPSAVRARWVGRRVRFGRVSLWRDVLRRTVSPR
ncbi:hypothetical protein Abr02nite_53750 [Paractinoplanes brasiliensis]|nr:hypothetical protein Abr02nite_53750 [Actinoplanes brasiliensis]